MTSRTLAAKRLGALGPLGLVAQQVAVVLHRRAAAGRVDDDGRRSPRAPRSSRGQLARLRRRRPRAAAARRSSAAPRRVHLEALGRQHPHGRRVDVAEEDALDAALQQRDAPARARPTRPASRSGSRRDAARSGVVGASGGQPRREPLARAAASFGSPSAVRQRRSGRQRAQPAGVREQREDRRRRSALAPRARAQWRSTCGARVLDQLVVLHARRARGHAGHAAEAAVAVRRPSRGDSSASSCPRCISTIRPRGESISSPHSDVGRAGRQAEAAVHAVVDQVELAAVGASHVVTKPAAPAELPCRVEALLDAPHQQRGAGVARPQGSSARRTRGRARRARRTAQRRAAARAAAATSAPRRSRSQDSPSAGAPDQRRRRARSAARPARSPGRVCSADTRTTSPPGGAGASRCACPERRRPRPRARPRGRRRAAAPRPRSACCRAAGAAEAREHRARRRRPAHVEAPALERRVGQRRARPPASGRGSCARARRGRRRGAAAGAAARATSTITPSVPNEPGEELAEVVAGDVLDHLAARAWRPCRRPARPCMPTTRSRAPP